MAINPFDNSSSQINAALKNFKLVNPIPEECTDSKELKKLFNKNPYIPYSGYTTDSQHTVLRFIDNLAALSPTLGGVIKSIGFACFGGKTDIKSIVDSDFDIAEEGEEPIKISKETKLKYLDQLKTIDLNPFDWSSFKNVCFRSLKANGNVFIEVEINQSLGQYKSKITFHPTRNVLYKIPDLFTERTVAISKSWVPEYIKQNPPREVPVFPLVEKDKKGTIKTVFHYKHGENDFYGRPDWLPCMMDAFLEIKNKEYLLTAAHNNFTGKVYIEKENGPGNDTQVENEDAIKAGFDNVAHRWAYNFTNQGTDPQSILLSERAFGAGPSFIHEFNINTNEDYYKKIDQLTTSKICLVNGWSPKLLGIDEGGGLSSNVYIDILKTRMPLIEYYQDSIDNGILNKIITFINEFTGKNEFLGIGIASKNPFDHLEKANKEAALNNQKTKTNDNNLGG